MLIKTTNKKDAYTALINTLLKDPTQYCSECGTPFHRGMPKCCEEAQIGTNMEICSAIIAQVREARETRQNAFASTKNKSLRWGISLPAFIYEGLRDYEAKHHRKFLDKTEDIVWFARNFPQFAIPKAI